MPRREGEVFLFRDSHPRSFGSGKGIAGQGHIARDASRVRASSERAV